MRIGFVVNDVATEKAYYTTIRLALAAVQAGHEVWLAGAGDFASEPDGTVSAMARSAAVKSYRSLERYLKDVQRPGSERRVAVDDTDVVLLRNDPAADALEHPWAPTAAVAFGQLIARRGALVVNHPDTLAQALSKAYFHHFPDAVQPRTLISRDKSLITGFIDELGGRAVLKPLQGSGGSGVFLVNRRESPNLSQIIEAIGRDGYIVAQEYLEEAEDGDVRLFLMNGRPLMVKGQAAAFRRRRPPNDIRSNMSVGGQAEPVRLTDGMLRLAEIVRPKLVADGLFIVGLDIVGDKLMEINVFSPGGLGSCASLYGKDFAAVVVADLERKMELHTHHGGALGNARLATL
jgi:glutathione synthase